MELLYLPELTRYWLHTYLGPSLSRGVPYTHPSSHSLWMLEAISPVLAAGTVPCIGTKETKGELIVKGDAGSQDT